LLADIELGTACSGGRSAALTSASPFRHGSATLPASDMAPDRKVETMKRGNATEDALDDADDVAIFDERMRDLKSGKDVPLSAEESAAIPKGGKAPPTKMRRTLIAIALFGFTAWSIVTFALMVAKWTSQVQDEHRIQRQSH
jgi:hypothetical protein